VKKRACGLSIDEPEPMRWSGPNVIAFRRRILYERNDKPGFENDIHRRYEIAMTISDDGKVTTECKRIKEDNQ
jgi:hypothetical protein